MFAVFLLGASGWVTSELNCRIYRHRGSWASYKALLGEWEEAKEIVKAKTDEAAARRQQCTLEDIVSNLSKDSTLDDLKLAYILMESRGQTKWAGPNCRPEPLVEFLNREIKIRGFLASNAGR